jgi:hypothetical protein
MNVVPADGFRELRGGGCVGLEADRARGVELVVDDRSGLGRPVARVHLTS